MTEIDADRLARVYGAYIDRFRPTGVLDRIVRELATGTPSRLHILEIMGENGTDDDVLRAGMLDLLLEYISAALDDSHLSPEEQSSVRYLKSMLNVSEGDFWRLRKPEITYWRPSSNRSWRMGWYRGRKPFRKLSYSASSILGTISLWR